MADMNKMLEKVQKLLALAGNNPSEEEAKMAMRRAQEIIAKYNLDENALRTGEEKVEYAVVVCEHCYKDAFRHPLAAAIARAFRCKTAICGSNNAFIGHKQDAEVACEVFRFAMKTCFRLGDKVERKARATYGTARGVFPSYAMGFAEGVKKSLDEGCKALMIVVPSDVNDYYKSKVTGKAYHSHSNVTLSADIYNQGVADGYSVMKSRTLKSGC